MKKLLALGLIILMALPANVLAAGEEATIKQLQEQIQKLSAQLDALAKQVEANKMAAQSAPKAPAAPATQAGQEEIKELAKRLDKVEKHSVLDRIEFTPVAEAAPDLLAWCLRFVEQGFASADETASDRIARTASHCVGFHVHYGRAIVEPLCRHRHAVTSC